MIKRLRNNAIKIRVDYKWGIPSPPVVFSTNLCFQAGFWTCESAYYFNASVSPLTMLKTMWWAALSLWYDVVSASFFWPDDTFLKEGSDKIYFLVLSSHFPPIFTNWIIVDLQYVLVLCVQHSDSGFFLQIIFHYRLLQDVGHNSLFFFFLKVAQSCLTLCDPMDYTVHGIPQARILEWVAFPFSKGSSQARDQTQVSCIAGGFFTS